MRYRYQPPPGWMTDKQLGERWNINPGTLKTWRHQDKLLPKNKKKSPPSKTHNHLGIQGENGPNEKRMVIYKISEVERFEKARRGK